MFSQQNIYHWNWKNLSNLSVTFSKVGRRWKRILNSLYHGSTFNYFLEKNVWWASFYTNLPIIKDFFWIAFIITLTIGSRHFSAQSRILLTRHISSLVHGDRWLTPSHSVPHCSGNSPRQVWDMTNHWRGMLIATPNDKKTFFSNWACHETEWPFTPLPLPLQPLSIIFLMQNV